jgi:hypothetical protein
MYRLAVSAVAIGMLVTGCFGPMVTAPVDAACQEHADPVDCQAALEVALGGLTLDPRGLPRRWPDLVQQSRVHDVGQLAAQCGRGLPSVVRGRSDPWADWTVDGSVELPRRSGLRLRVLTAARVIRP